ncbi:MAG TPA: phosphoesterase [Phycisphaerae bacterium]|nr:phosphoesterase [Phycisphaerae bacterium]
MSDIFFVSDTHFGHANVIKYDGRPFGSVEEHDAELIRRWNVVVKPGDRVFHLGDFGWAKKASEISAIVAQLNGQKHLLLGNHDRDAVRKSEGWAWVKEYHELKVDLGGERRQKVVLSHYPLLVWNGGHHKPGSWMLHGHCHGSLTVPDTTRLDMGVNSWAYAPVSLAEVAAAMAGREYVVYDQHDERGGDL